jgi:hypothetical protein
LAEDVEFDLPRRFLCAVEPKDGIRSAFGMHGPVRRQDIVPDQDLGFSGYEERHPRFTSLDAGYPSLLQVLNQPCDLGGGILGDHERQV